MFTAVVENAKIHIWSFIINFLNLLLEDLGQKICFGSYEWSKTKTVKRIFQYSAFIRTYRGIKMANKSFEKLSPMGASSQKVSLPYYCRAMTEHHGTKLNMQSYFLSIWASKWPIFVSKNNSCGHSRQKIGIGLVLYSKIECIIKKRLQPKLILM